MARRCSANSSKERNSMKQSLQMWGPGGSIGSSISSLFQVPGLFGTISQVVSKCLVKAGGSANGIKQVGQKPIWDVSD